METLFFYVWVKRSFEMTVWSTKTWIKFCHLVFLNAELFNSWKSQWKRAQEDTDNQRRWRWNIHALFGEVLAVIREEQEACSAVMVSVYCRKNYCVFKVLLKIHYILPLELVQVSILCSCFSLFSIVCNLSVKKVLFSRVVLIFIYIFITIRIQNLNWKMNWTWTRFPTSQAGGHGHAFRPIHV